MRNRLNHRLKSSILNVFIFLSTGRRPLESIPAKVRQFLQSHIESIEQLEILRVLGENRSVDVSEDEICQRAQVPREVVHLHLQALASRGLLHCWQTDAKTVCRYGPHSAELHTAVEQLLDAYRHWPVTMIRLVYERRVSALQDFSDAFRFRRKD